MGETPMSALTLLCSGIQLYSAEQRIADCILADVKWAASATSAELARQSQASEATVTRLCHKLGFESYRKFQLALARDVMEQQEAEKKPRGGSAGPDAEHPAKNSSSTNRKKYGPRCRRWMRTSCGQRWPA